MRVATLSIGDELLNGWTLDRNGAWLASRCESRGAEVLTHRVVRDDRVVIAQAICELALGCDMLIATGGLGPTEDDQTREGLADALGDELVEDEQAHATLAAKLATRGRTVGTANRRQVRRPASACMIANPAGTAPAIDAQLGDCRVVCLPGPPHEMRAVFDAELAGSVGAGQREDASAIVEATGLSESRASELLGELGARDAAPIIGTTVSASVLRARIRGVGAAACADEVEKRWAPYAYARGHLECSSLAAWIVDALAERKTTIATAESCTGGLIGGALTDVPGSSAVYGGGVVTYSNALKTALLGVDSAVLERLGAVSEPVAVVMAMEAARRMGADYALSATGIAGPDGGTNEKPSGTVWIGLSDASGAMPQAFARCFHFPGTRTEVRRRTVLSALQLFRFHLIGVDARLLWECAR